MAVEFDNNTTDAIDCGSDASIDDFVAFTMVLWVYRLTEDGTQPHFMSKGDDIKNFSESQDGTAELFARVGRATTNADAIGDTNIGTGAWVILAMTYDESDGIRLFLGSLTSLIAEETSYDTQVTGEGDTVDDASVNLFIGNRPPSDSRAGDNRIAVAAYINKRMTLPELQEWQYHPHVTAETRGLWVPNNVTTQADLSGNGNNGSGTGLILADHVPLGPMFGFDTEPEKTAVVTGGRIMGSLAGHGGLAGPGGIAGKRGGIAA